MTGDVFKNAKIEFWVNAVILAGFHSCFSHNNFKWSLQVLDGH